jgi:hypothetical protein
MILPLYSKWSGDMSSNIGPDSDSELQIHPCHYVGYVNKDGSIYLF